MGLEVVAVEKGRNPPENRGFVSDRQKKQLAFGHVPLQWVDEGITAFRYRKVNAHARNRIIEAFGICAIELRWQIVVRWGCATRIIRRLHPMVVSFPSKSPSRLRCFVASRKPDKDAGEGAAGGHRLSRTRRKAGALFFKWRAEGEGSGKSFPCVRGSFLKKVSPLDVSKMPLA